MRTLLFLIGIRHTKLFFILFMITLAVTFGTKSDRYFGWSNEEAKKGEPILSDGSGYYCYLPQWFIYKTSNFEFLPKIEKTYKNSRFANNLYFTKGKATNKYYTGTAFSMIPFFAVAHIYAKSTDYPADGYSKPYQFMANFASVFYLLLGCLGIYFLLRRYHIDRILIAVVLCMLVFGTDASYFTYVLTPFSHVFSFAIVAWMLFFAKKWADEHTAKHFILFCLFLGWAVMIRPTNVLVLAFVPFMFTSTQLFFGRLKLLFTKHWKHLLPGVAVFLLFLGFQLWNTYDQTGKFALNTYTTETFEFWTNPKIWDVLFSWRKGLFIFAPVLLLLLPGWYVLYRHQRNLFWGSIVFFAIFTYVTASWWCWWYGGGLGMRPYIDVLPVLAIPLAFLLQKSKWYANAFTLAFVLLTTWMYQVYEYQMKNNILHYDDMTYEQFARVFMKEDLRYGWCLHLPYESLPGEGFITLKQQSFMMFNEPMPQNRYFKLSGDDYNDNPQLMIYSDSTYKSNHFGASVTGEVYLYSGETNPTIEAEYFKDGVMFRKGQFFIGQFIAETEELSPVEIQIYPGLTYAEFDSVRIQFFEGNTFTGVKSLKIKELIFR
ncbi:MAG: hypothetical protein V4604_04150 [Bacteroidota bacterium]